MNNQYVRGIFSWYGNSVSCLRQNWLRDAQKSKLHNDEKATSQQVIIVLEL